MVALTGPERTWSDWTLRRQANHTNPRLEAWERRYGPEGMRYLNAVLLHGLLVAGLGVMSLACILLSIQHPGLMSVVVGTLVVEASLYVVLVVRAVQAERSGRRFRAA